MKIETIYKTKNNKNSTDKHNKQNNQKQNNENFDNLLQDEIEKLKEKTLDEIIIDNKIPIQQHFNQLNNINKNNQIIK